MRKEIEKSFGFLKENEAKMRPGQISFVNGLKKYYKSKKALTLNQAHILFEIENNVKGK